MRHEAAAFVLLHVCVYAKVKVRQLFFLNVANAASLFSLMKICLFIFGCPDIKS